MYIDIMTVVIILGYRSITLGLSLTEQTVRASKTGSQDSVAWGNAAWRLTRARHGAQDAAASRTAQDHG